MSSRRMLSAAVVIGGVVLVAGCSATTKPEAAPSTPATTSTTASAVPAALDDFAAIPRTNVSLRVPDGMVVDENLPGLAKPSSRTSILVMTMPVTGEPAQQALDGMAASFTGTKAAEQGLELEPVRRLTIAGHPAFTTTGVQRTSSGTYDKAIAVLAAGDTIVMMTGNAEQGSTPTAQDLSDVLTTARWNEQTAPGDLGFDLTPAAGYEHRQGLSGSLLITLGGESGAGVPKLLVSPSLGQAGIDEGRRREFAVKRFETLPAKPSAGSTAEVEIAGLPGFEMTGTGSRGGETVYAVVLFTDDGYFVIGGDFDPSRHPDQLPAFREMARSLVLS